MNTVWNQLVGLVGRKYSAEESAILLNGLITPTERIVVAKRLMVGILTIQGYNTNQIASALHISTSTAFAHQRMVNKSLVYRKMLKKLYANPIDLSSADTSQQWVRELVNIFSQPKMVYKKKI